MATTEIGRFEIMVADMIIGRLHADGIAALPLSSGGLVGMRPMTGILVEEEDVGAARSIIAASDADFPE